MLGFNSGTQCAGILRLADAAHWTTSLQHEARGACAVNLQPSTTNTGGAVSVINECSLPVLLGGAFVGAAGRDGTRIHRKVHSSQSQRKGQHRRRSLRNVERLRKDVAQLLEFWTVWKFHTTARELHMLSARALQTPPKFHEKTHKSGKERQNENHKHQIRNWFWPKSR